VHRRRQKPWDTLRNRSCMSIETRSTQGASCYPKRDKVFIEGANMPHIRCSPALLGSSITVRFKSCWSGGSSFSASKWHKYLRIRGSAPMRCPYVAHNQLWPSLFARRNTPGYDMIAGNNIAHLNELPKDAWKACNDVDLRSTLFYTLSCFSVTSMTIPQVQIKRVNLHLRYAQFFLYYLDTSPRYYKRSVSCVFPRHGWITLCIFVTHQDFSMNRVPLSVTLLIPCRRSLRNFQIFFFLCVCTGFGIMVPLAALARKHACSLLPVKIVPTRASQILPSTWSS
jgi:hypothetical protein